MSRGKVSREQKGKRLDGALGGTFRSSDAMGRRRGRYQGGRDWCDWIWNGEKIGCERKVLEVGM